MKINPAGKWLQIRAPSLFLHYNGWSYFLYYQLCPHVSCLLFISFISDFFSSPPVSCVEACVFQLLSSSVLSATCLLLLSVSLVSPVPRVPSSSLVCPRFGFFFLFMAFSFVPHVFCHLPFVSFLSFLKLAFLFSHPPACVYCVWVPFCLTSRRSGSPPELAGPPGPHKDKHLLFCFDRETSSGRKFHILD